MRCGGDPYWFTARRPGVCRGCGEAFQAGTRVFVFKGGATFSGECAERQSLAFEAARQDEEFYGRGWGGA